ncbi:hypothetical protein TOT_040000772 [Theileria orientalis strain Shintoku]|uniref:Uncharacterized protein n=1 Tax=Theileria orientalis strain Shintoku TaxID=869250 RepID=J7M4Q4_THEOR|nr:hypothetical protein TOT_040000772 [Theileria orientalis strain Shintoku]PVC54759.1 hypothetical protein MACL_00000012 [Theileria orientalis]BAM42405.1 hypothetical protein TOT_040000772 [Theileria orientalis strain Shintoku]|eukprot:XP_009692706.1 hypothetical protein TOT_040000772 [Theileria orientalis strain Shintoku]
MKSNYSGAKTIKDLLTKWLNQTRSHIQWHFNMCSPKILADLSQYQHKNKDYRHDDTAPGVQHQKLKIFKGLL